MKEGIKKNKEQKGFTLLELLVVIALMGIIYAVTLSNYNGMNKSIELQNTAYNVALSIRESQIYGINKKLDSENFSDGNPYPFGLHIDTSDNNKIIIFKDKNNNQVFDGNCTVAGGECERLIIFNSGNKISNIRLNDNGTWKDASGKLNVMFKRPNPDAIIVDENTKVNYSGIGIELSSKSGIYKSCVQIGVAGDISLKKNCN